MSQERDLGMGYILRLSCELPLERRMVLLSDEVVCGAWVSRRNDFGCPRPWGSVVRYFDGHCDAFA